jgi:hypothetical protein
MAKVLHVVLGGPDGAEWQETFANIAAQRVKHFAGQTEVVEGTDQYKRLVEVSSRDAEVEDWARRFAAPEKLRGSWYHCKIAVKEVPDAAPEQESKPAEVVKGQPARARS